MENVEPMIKFIGFLIEGKISGVIVKQRREGGEGK